MLRHLIALCIVSAAFADEIAAPKKDDDKTPKNVSLSDSPEAALKKFAVAPGLRIEVWAAEPLLANPVALSFDDQGRAFVAETYRRRTSVPDIRKYEEWKLENLALRSVGDRIAFLKAKAPESAKAKPTTLRSDFTGDGVFDWRDWTVESEQVKLVWDGDGDGKADKSSVFATGFNSLATGVGAGVLAHGGSVYFTCTPDLWRIDGEQKTALHTGFGVHVVYSGHDMHGVKIGPDGRIYWSIADCGARLTTKEGKVLDNPDSGAVFRCDPDGSNLEVFATGLRNPQSLAWNELGDLFTGDNNADGGDKARWVHLVEGGDYGWSIGWQFLPKLGAWNTEGMWHLDATEKNLAVLPPVGHIGHGPAGIAYYPGTGLPGAYRDHFFYADFPGGVRDFALIPKGASYTVDNPKDILMDNSPQNMTGKTLWGLFPSDVAFAPGGGLYVLDWVQGWEKTGKGRIFRVFDPAADKAALETKRLLGEGFAKRGVEDLSALLGHADQRVRLGAQFELVRRGDPIPLAHVTLARNPQIMRVHGIWGIAQLARAKPGATRSLMPLAMDPDPEVRAQWAKCIGEARAAGEVDLVRRLLADREPRVQFFAAQALGQLADTKSAPALARLAVAAKADPHLRHAAVRALVRCEGEAEAVRAGGEVALLTLRALRSPKVADFLAVAVSAAPPPATPAKASAKKKPRRAAPAPPAIPPLALEAARAIHDAPIPEAWPQLAALAETTLPEPISRRAINANYLLGTPEAAQRLGRIAANAKAPQPSRLFAIESLAIWTEPFGQDRITGLWRKLPPRADAQGAAEVAAQLAPALLADADDAIRLAATALRTPAAEPALLALAADAKAKGEVRAAALHALSAMKSTALADAVTTALSDKDTIVLDTARDLAEAVSPELAVKVNAAVLGKGGTREQQAALATIARQPVADADAAIAAQLDRLAAGKLPKQLQLDLLEAAAQRTDATVKAKLAAYEETRKADDPLAAWRECLEGGDSKLGREAFYEKAEAACLRCHKVKGEGGDVGPDLAGFGAKHDREYILRAIIDPSAVIAPGYENVMFTLTDEKTIVAGLLSAEDATSVTIKSLTDSSTQRVEKTKIKERITVPSAMPPGLGEVLGKRALRDVVEYLAKLK
ncbi:MAG: HEAT repeat domain-containing protein [Chthoniobacteraceae bacterium]